MLFNTVLFTGNANPVLAQEIANHLGIDVGQADVGRFSDGEVTVEIQQNVRARDVYVVQPTCAPTNENLMELAFMVDAQVAGDLLRQHRVGVAGEQHGVEQHGGLSAGRSGRRASRACPGTGGDGPDGYS